MGRAQIVVLACCFCALVGAASRVTARDAGDWQFGFVISTTRLGGFLVTYSAADHITLDLSLGGAPEAFFMGGFGISNVCSKDDRAPHARVGFSLLRNGCGRLDDCQPDVFAFISVATGRFFVLDDRAMFFRAGPALPVAGDMRFPMWVDVEFGMMDFRRTSE